MSDYWYENRSMLREGHVCILEDGSTVKLDRRVPCDGTQWYVADWEKEAWRYEDRTIEPSEIQKGPLW